MEKKTDKKIKICFIFLTVYIVLTPLKAKRKLDLEDPVYLPEFRTPTGKCSVAARIPSPKSECKLLNPPQNCKTFTARGLYGPTNLTSLDFSLYHSEKSMRNDVGLHKTAREAARAAQSIKD